MRNIIHAFVVLLVFVACSSEKPDNLEPVVMTLQATDVTRTSAVLRGSVTLMGNAVMPTLCFKYGISEAMQLQASVSAANDGDITALVGGLEAGTSYYYQLQGTNGRGTIGGETLTFTTLPNSLPTVGEIAVLSKGPVSAILAFDIPSDGGATIGEAGCYVVEGWVEDVKNAEGAWKVTAEREMGAENRWRITVSGLKQNATYTLCPYAVNNVGEGIGKPFMVFTENTVKVGEPGDFCKLMQGWNSMDSIVVSGPMNGDDFKCLRKLDPVVVNLIDAHIVKGGGAYNESYYTEDNVVGQRMFDGCGKLMKIQLPDDAISVGKDAFSNCHALTEITIPASASEVLPSADCVALVSVKVSKANLYFASVDGVLTDAATTRIVWFPMGKTGEYRLPPTIMEIGDYAFSHCNITNFVLPQDLSTMGQAVFYGSKVEAVTLPDKLKTLPSATFQECMALATVRIGAGTELISDYVFDGCPLTDLRVEALIPPVCRDKTFASKGNDIRKKCTLHVPKGRAVYYKAAEGWRDFSHIVEEE